MAYALALPAVALPVWLIVQTIRGRVKPSCCTPPSAGVSAHDIR